MSGPVNAAWRTPGNCEGGACVETASAETGVLVRDTEDRAGFTLTVPAHAWNAFTTALKGGAA